MIVVGPTIGPVTDPMVIAIPIVLADAAFLLMRRLVSSHSASHTSLGAK